MVGCLTLLISSEHVLQIGRSTTKNDALGYKEHLIKWSASGPKEANENIYNLQF